MKSKVTSLPANHEAIAKVAEYRGPAAYCDTAKCIMVVKTVMGNVYGYEGNRLSDAVVMASISLISDSAVDVSRKAAKDLGEVDPEALICPETYADMVMPLAQNIAENMNIMMSKDDKPHFRELAPTWRRALAEIEVMRRAYNQPEVSP